MRILPKRKHVRFCAQLIACSFVKEHGLNARAFTRDLWAASLYPAELRGRQAQILGRVSYKIQCIVEACAKSRRTQTISRARSIPTLAWHADPSVANSVLQFPNAQRGKQERFCSRKSACGSHLSFRVGMCSRSGGAGARTAASVILRFTSTPVGRRAGGEFSTIHN